MHMVSTVIMTLCGHEQPAVLNFRCTLIKKGLPLWHTFA